MKSRTRTNPSAMIGRAAIRGLLIAICAAVSAIPASAQQMLFPGDTWQTATPESVLVDSYKLETAVQMLRNYRQSVNELLIVRNGRVIWQGNNVDGPFPIWSATKTYASTVLGLLVDDGKIALEDLAQEYVPAAAEHYPDTTVRHFATNTSGYMAVGDVALVGTFTPNPDPFNPAAPLFSPPGSQFAYSHMGWDMLANILTKAANEKLEDIFIRRIAEPLSFDFAEFDWREYVLDEELDVNGGEGWVSTGVVVSAENAARLAHLYLNQGNWNGEQLLGSEWVDAATAVQVPSSIPKHPKSETNIGPGLYGYAWWVYPSWYRAWGHKNNYFCASPDAGFVVARVGTQTGTFPISSLESQLLAATIPAVWDGAGDGLWDEFDPETGKPRWRTESGLVPDIYPTSKAIVRSNTVTVANDLPIATLDIESGTVLVAQEGLLRSRSRITLHEEGELLLDGRIEAGGMGVGGLIDVSATGQLHAGEVTIHEHGRISNGGAAEFGQFTLYGGEARILPEGRLAVSQLYQLGGRLSVEGEFAVGDCEINGGVLEFRDHQQPCIITQRFRLLDSSELRFVITDECWNSTIQLADGISPRFSGDLVLDFAESLDPELLRGKTLNLFDWSDGIAPAGTFARILAPAGVELDTSRLYSTGDILVRAVPEPGSWLLSLCVLLSAIATRRTRGRTQ